MTTSYRRVLLLLLLMFIPFAALYSPANRLPLPRWESLMSGDYISALDSHINGNLPFQGGLRQLNLRMGLLSGQNMQNDIFISKDGLIRNIAEPSEMLVEENTRAVLQFAEHVGRPTYLMLVPTASAILQQQLPEYAQIYNNQKLFIEDVYQDVASQITAVNVYPVLFNRREQYIYYRTEDNLTALGGFYMYSALGSKLGLDTRNIKLSQYDIEYTVHNYYGNLYQKSPYQVVRPDVLMTFHYTRYTRKYTVTHINGNDVKTYHTLYPTHLSDLGEEMNIFFGGVSAITDIQVSSPYPRSILIFGDKTALSYLPFLANSFQQVTLVDLFRLSSEDYPNIHPENYNQILFAYSVETFDTGVPRLAERLFDYLPEESLG